MEQTGDAGYYQKSIKCLWHYQVGFSAILSPRPDRPLFVFTPKFPQFSLIVSSLFHMLFLHVLQFLLSFSMPTITNHFFFFLDCPPLDCLYNIDLFILFWLSVFVSGGKPTNWDGTFLSMWRRASG